MQGGHTSGWMIGESLQFHFPSRRKKGGRARSILNERTWLSEPTGPGSTVELAINLFLPLIKGDFESEPQEPTLSPQHQMLLFRSKCSCVFFLYMYVLLLKPRHNKITARKEGWWRMSWNAFSPSSKSGILLQFYFAPIHPSVIEKGKLKELSFCFCLGNIFSWKRISAKAKPLDLLLTADSNWNLT